MTVSITAERPDTADATALINELEDHLASLYPAESRHGFSVQRADGRPAGCGGILLVGRAYGELKRMYVRPEFRGRKFGEQLIARLAEHARAQGVTTLRLETGTQQHAAIALYERVGFRAIPPFPPYFDDPHSRCYEMKLIPA
jgi:putative acetyltransferase